MRPMIPVRRLAPQWTVGLPLRDAPVRADPGHTGAMDMTVTRTGPARPADVWQHYERLDLWTVWAPHLTNVRADSATLAFEQLTLLVRESEGGRDLPRDDIRTMLHLMVDVVVQMKKIDGRFLMTEVWHDPLRKRQPGD